MNYRHGFHAGNFADVFKHAILARILVYLTRKDAPLRYIDTHAGAGRYDLTSEAAKRSPEWRDGVGRIVKARPPAEVAALLRPYLDAIGPCDDDGRPDSYPGSPALAQSLLRPQDRLALSEAHPEERAALIAALGRDRRLSIVATDGYVALNAYVPPKERRGLVLIDPPFEEPDEDARFLNAIAALGAPNILRLELDVGVVAPGAHSPNPLRAAGLLIVNPPFELIAEARVLMPWLAQALKRAAGGGFVRQWLTPPA